MSQLFPQSPETSEALDKVSEASRISDLAKLSPIEYDRIRNQAATELGIRASTLDHEVARIRDCETPKGGELVEVEPYPHPIADLPDLMNQITNVILKFLVCPTENANAAAIWITST